MTLKRRLRWLEASLKYQDIRHKPDISTDDIIRKLGLDPDALRAIAKENKQSMAEVIADELGMSLIDFKEALMVMSRRHNINGISERID